MIKASSLYESIIAIAIISIVITMGTMIFFNITSSRGLSYYNLTHKIDLIKIESLDDKDLKNKKYLFKDYTIFRKIENHSSSKNLFIISIVVFKNDREILAKKYLTHRN